MLHAVVTKYNIRLISSDLALSPLSQIAFSYGFGSVESWHFTPNVVYVPGAVFSPDEDHTQYVFVEYFPGNLCEI